MKEIFLFLVTLIAFAFFTYFVKNKLKVYTYVDLDDDSNRSEKNYKKTDDDFLSESIEDLNSLCPMPCAMRQITKIFKEEKYIVYHCETTMYLDREIDSLMIRSLLLSGFILTEETYSKKTIELAKKGYGFIWEFEGITNKRLVINQSSLLSIWKFVKEHPSDAVDELFYLQIGENKDTMIIDNGLIYKSMEYDGNSVITIISVDEHYYDMDLLTEELYKIKKAHFESLLEPTPLNNWILNLCEKTNKSLVWRYVGNKSGQKVDVVVTPIEIKNRKVF